MTSDFRTNPLEDFKSLFRRFESFKKNEEILVVKEREIPRETFFGLFKIETELKLGVLDSLQNSNPELEDLIISTERYVEKNNDNSSNTFSRAKWNLKEGPISISWSDFLNLRKEIPRRNFPIEELSTPRSSLAIYLGKEVGKYFENKSSGLRFKLKDLWLSSYIEGLDLLGVKPSEKFRKKYEEEVYLEAIKFINELEELSKREEKLKFGVCDSFKDDFPRDAKLASIRKRRSLEKIRGEILEYLVEGLELGMHKKDLRIHLKPGIEVNLPVYISGMFEKYKVKT